MTGPEDVGLHVSGDDIRRFLFDGYLLLKACISDETVAQWAVSGNARAAAQMKNMPAHLSPGRFRIPATRGIPLEILSPRAWNVCCGLLGGKSRIQSATVWDSMVVSIGNPEMIGQWQPPSPERKGWHKDGNTFRHFLDSPEQGLVLLVFWTDVGPKGGGTFIALDSVSIVAELLARTPEGLLPEDFDYSSLIRRCSRFAEVTAKAGDIAILHPFLLHAGSRNCSSTTRLISNSVISLLSPLNLNRSHMDEFSILETSIVRALGQNRIRFVPQGSRESFPPRW